MLKIRSALCASVGTYTEVQNNTPAFFSCLLNTCITHVCLSACVSVWVCIWGVWRQGTWCVYMCMYLCVFVSLFFQILLQLGEICRVCGSMTMTYGNIRYWSLTHTASYQPLFYHSHLPAHLSRGHTYPDVSKRTLRTPSRHNLSQGVCPVSITSTQYVEKIHTHRPTDL